MYVDTVQKADRVSAERIVNEAAGWGMRRAQAVEIVGDTLERMPSAVSLAASHTSGIADELVELVAARVTRLAGGAPAG